MKLKFLYSFILILVTLAFLNYIWVKKYGRIGINELPGLYVFSNSTYSDTLILHENHTSTHSFYNKTTKEYKSKVGGWGSVQPGILIIQDYSFAQANHDVDLRYYLDFFWRIKIDFNMYDTYSKIYK